MLPAGKPPGRLYQGNKGIRGQGPLYWDSTRTCPRSILASSSLKNNTVLRSLARHSYILYCLTKLRSLYQLIVKERIEVIHTHLHYSFLMASLLGREFKIPVVCQIPQMRSQTAITAPWTFTAYKLLNRYVSSFYTNISEEELIRYGHIPKEKIQFISGVVDLEGIRPVERKDNPVLAEFGLQDAYPIVLSMGRFVPEKGHKHAIHVAERLKAAFPRPRLFIMGEGWELERYRTMVREKNLQDVIILPGYRRDLHYFYSLADIYLRTCLLEGGSLANYHAMAYGNPIVGFETKAPTETITHDVNGFLAPLGDERKMADLVMELAGNQELRQKISGESRNYAYQKLDIMQSIRTFEDDYERLCRDRTWRYRKGKAR